MRAFSCRILVNILQIVLNAPNLCRVAFVFNILHVQRNLCRLSPKIISNENVVKKISSTMLPRNPANKKSNLDKKQNLLTNFLSKSSKNDKNFDEFNSESCMNEGKNCSKNNSNSKKRKIHSYFTSKYDTESPPKKQKATTSKNDEKANTKSLYEIEMDFLKNHLF